MGLFRDQALIVLRGWVVLEGGDYAKRFEVLDAQVKPGVFKPDPEWALGVCRDRFPERRESLNYAGGETIVASLLSVRLSRRAFQ